MLLFKKKFLDPIRRGEKTQTIRLWKYRRMKAGQRSYILGIGYIAIRSVDPVEIDHLTDADALPDGFETAAALREELQTLYAKEIAMGFVAFRVCFAVFPPKDQQRMIDEKRCAQEKRPRQRSQRQAEDSKKQEFVDSTIDKLRKMAQRAGKARKKAPLPQGEGSG